jgi:two-component system phosphate regulon response regulator OmpR
MIDAPHILVVDDDSRIRGLLKKYLSRNGYAVSEARDAAHARRLLGGLAFDLLVIDVMMPGEDGFSLTKALRQTMDTPVMLLTARGEAEDRIEGLEVGADDYLPKPFEPRELLLRISAILRRSAEPAEEGATPEPPKTLSLGNCRYDLTRGELWRGEELIRLTTAESAMMRLMARQAGEPVSRTALLAEVGGSEEPSAQERAIDVQVTRLRRKIEENPRVPRYLQTVRGAGYMLAPD